MKIKDEQHLFDTIIQGFVKQGAPAQDYDSDPINRYRLKVGKKVYKSAIGQVLQAKDYSEKMEGQPPVKIIRQFEHLKPYLYLLSRLEKMHDDYIDIHEEKDWTEWVRDEGNLIANRFNLDPSVLQSLHQ